MAKKKKAIVKKINKKKITKKKLIVKKATKKKYSSYPFIYLGQGIAMARKYIDFYICFKEIPSETAKKEVESCLPEIIDESSWTNRVFIFGHHTFLESFVKQTYKKIKDPKYVEDPNYPSNAQWKAFNTDIDQFIIKIQKKYPIHFALKPIDEEYGTKLDKWHEWSVEKVISDILFLANELEEIIYPIQYAAYLWCIWTDAKPIKEKKKILQSLSAEQIRLLKKWEYLPEIEGKPTYDPAPTMKEMEQLIPTLLNHPTGMRIEEAFIEAFANRKLEYIPTLHDYLNQLEEKKEYKKIVALCQLALMNGVIQPDFWWQMLADALLALKKVEKATEAVREVVWYIETYHSSMLLTCMDYHRAKGEKEIEAMLYHAGRKWFTSFSSCFTKKQAAKYGRAPKNLNDHFANWLQAWIEPKFSIKENDNIGHWIHWLEEIESDVFSTWIQDLKNEVTRRNNLYDQLKKSTNKEEQKKLIDLILEFKNQKDEGILNELAHLFLDESPELAFKLYKHAMEIEGKNGFKYQSFYQSANQILYTAIKYNPGRELALKLGIPWGHKNPAIFHNAACIASLSKKKEETLFYIECAIKYEYKDMKLLLDDPDLDFMREDERFKKLKKKF